MGIQQINTFLMQYGAIAIFVIVFLEYLSLPGFPAGIIMPAAGIWAAQGGMSFFFVMVVSVAAGLCGSWCLYALGRFGGFLFLEKFMNRFPKQRPGIERMLEKVRTKGFMGVFVAKLIPAVRTLVSIPAGVVGMEVVGYTLFSLLGIVIWNGVFIGAGYLLGDAALSFFGG